MSKKVKMTMGVLVIVAAMAYLMASSFSGSGFQVSISDLINRGDSYANDYLLVEGTVLRETVEWDGQKIELRFTVTDGEYQLPVLYKDVPPDNLEHEDGAEAILKGSYDSIAGVFNADKVETRCPSKYEPAE